MTVSRRRLFQYLAITGGCGASAEGAEPALTLDVLRDVSALHGTNFGDDRLRVVKPVLEHLQVEWRALRDFEIAATVAPTQGLLDK
jgi:hypothetical protein